jgi:N-acetylneuraminate synthase
MNRFKIGSKWLGPGEPTYFIADIAANHDGDLGRAKKLIELAKAAGADAAKFQNFQASKIVSRHGFERLGKQLAHQSKWKKSVYEVYEDASIDKDWTPILKEHCDKVGIEYFTSPYDVESVDLVDRYVEAYKIGSGDITFKGILEYIAAKKKPMILATGASTLADVLEAMTTLRRVGGAEAAICLMQCNTNYTGSLENFKFIHLNVLKTYSLLFPDALLGLSDHTPGHATVLGAVALGARAIEKHFTDDNGRDGPDHAFSMNPATWREMVDRTRELEYALGSAEKKIEPNERQSAVVQRRGLYLTRDVRKGQRLSAECLEALRPAPENCAIPTELETVVGLAAGRDYKEGDCLLWSDWG